MKTVLNLSFLCAFVYLKGIAAASSECPAVDPVDRSVYLPHETDCSKFYECSNGVPILLECPNGTLFNTDLDVCDWPENVVCQKQKCPDVDPVDTSVYLPHESDCSKFYQCSNGVPIELSCPSGLVFNTKLNVCDYPQNVDSCSGSGGNGSGGDGENGGNDGNDDIGNNEESGDDSIESGENVSGSDESGSGSEESGSGSGASGECPAVDPLDTSVYLPHESDCSKFYQCSNGVPVEQSCPGELVFNTKLNVCDYPNNVDSCPGSSGNGTDENGGNGGNDGNDDIGDNEGSGDDSSESGENVPGSDESGSGSEDSGSGSGGSGECPAVDPLDTSVYLPHESDCSKFYQCSNGVPVEQSCPGELVFNTKLNVCDYPNNVDSCPDSSGNGTDENGGNGGNDGNDDIGDNEGSGDDSSESGENVPGSDESGSGSEESGSGSGGSGECPAVDPLDHSVYLPHESDCSKFYQCSNGVPILLECPNGTLFNTDLNVCDWPDNVVCQKQKCPEVDPIDTSIYLPHESDCSKFYQCSNGVPIEQSCPSGLVFNTNLNVCDYPSNVGSC